MDDFEFPETDLQHLMIRYLEGSAGEEEIQALQEWLGASGQHWSLFDRLRLEWLKAGCLQRYPVDKGWKKLEPRLLGQRAGKRFRLWKRIGRYAAVFLLFMGGGYYSVRYVRQEHRPMTLNEQQIRPGSEKAVLVLGSNERVELDSGWDGACLPAGTPVKKDGNTLVYEEKPQQHRGEEYNRLITPRGGEYTVILSDGTKVWLNSESELKYPVHFTGDERKVCLKGEAYFAVTRQNGHKFVVAVGEAQVTVLGTEFNVRNYQNESLAATLVKGSVRVKHGNGLACELKPGQQAVIGAGGIQVKNVETVYYTAWKDGFFMYEDRALEEILHELSRWYDFTYFYQNSELGKEILTAKLRKFDSVDKIFEILSETGHFGFVTKGKTVTVIAK